MRIHKHRPLKSVVRPWNACVNPRRCSGVPHGNIIEVQTCRCGAIRAVEVNAGRRTRGAWKEVG